VFFKGCSNQVAKETGKHPFRQGAKAPLARVHDKRHSVIKIWAVFGGRSRGGGAFAFQGDIKRGNAPLLKGEGNIRG